MDQYATLLRVERQQFRIFSGIYVALRQTPPTHPAYASLKAACWTAERYWQEARAAFDAYRERLVDGAPAPAPPRLVEADDRLVATDFRGAAILPRHAVGDPLLPRDRLAHSAK